MEKTDNSQNGSILISLIIVLPYLILITAVYLQLAVNQLSVAKKDQTMTYAQFSSDAGIDYAMQKINQDPLWAGTAADVGNTAGQIEIQNENNVRTTMEVTVTTIDSDNKTMTSIGRTFRPASSTTAASTKKIKVDLRPVKQGSYSIVTGVGGLYMSNNARIMGGDVLVNGEIVMSNTAQIGLSFWPVNVEVAHQTCPVPATSSYPLVCTAGENGQPITLNNSSHIYGTVKANNQTTGTGMSDPGLVAGSVTPGALPTHNRTALINAIPASDPLHNISGTSASCSGSTSKTWPANTKITGDVTISSQCKVTIEGNIWITGKLALSNSARIIVSNTLGSTVPDIMVDGQNITLNNSAAILPNSSFTGARLVTYYSLASCSPDCSDVTGIDLYNSRSIDTIQLNNSSAAFNTVLYARWTGVRLTNSGGVGAIVGQTVNLNNSAAITFGSSVTVEGRTFWVIGGYRRAQ